MFSHEYFPLLNETWVFENQPPSGLKKFSQLNAWNLNILIQVLKRQKDGTYFLIFFVSKKQSCNFGTELFVRAPRKPPSPKTSKSSYGEKLSDKANIAQRNHENKDSKTV